MRLWTIPIADFNDSIERARRQGQRLWAAQALTRFAFSDDEAIPLRNFSQSAKKNLTFIDRERKLDS